MKNLLVGNGINIQFDNFNYSTKQIVLRILKNCDRDDFPSHIIVNFPYLLKNHLGQLFIEARGVIRGEYDKYANCAEERRSIEAFKEQYNSRIELLNMTDIGFEDYYLINDLVCHKTKITNPDQFYIREAMRVAYLYAIYNDGHLNNLYESYSDKFIDFLNEFDSIFTTNYDNNIDSVVDSVVYHVHGQFNKLAAVYDEDSFRNKLPDAPIKSTSIDPKYFYLYSNALSTHSGAYKELQIKQHSLANAAIEKLVAAYNCNPKVKNDVDSWIKDENTITANMGHAVRLKIENPELEFKEDYHLDKLSEIKGELNILGLSPWNDFHIFESIDNSKIDKCLSYVAKYYGTDKALNFVVGKVDELIGIATSSTGVSLVNTFTKLFANYIYVDAKADDITQAIMQTSFVSSIDICLSQYRLKFLQGKGTTADIETYEQLYGSYLSAIKCTLDSCYDLSKISDKFSHGGDCMVWSANIETLYTYDKYIEWCKDEVAYDIENAMLDTSGNSTITDALNEETIAAQLERIYKLYPPNKDEIWNGNFDGTTDSLGFVAKMFNHIFDKLMCAKVKNDYQYILTSNVNVRTIGRLEDSGVTVSALKELFANARIGDIVITSGQYDYLHAMILTEVTDNGIVVYDCGSEYAEDSAYNRVIRKYEFSYEKMADAFSTNGVYTSKPGLSVYRAIKKINTSSTTSTNSSLYYEEYDDSVNYVINNGVLEEYRGSRTTLKIPDSVTEIMPWCFSGNTTIKYVYMPDTVTTIGAYSFMGCTNLRYVDLPNTLTSVNSHTFCDCKLLTRIVLPDSITSIGEHAFSGCENLTNITIPDNVISIDDGAFWSSGLKSVTMSDGLTSIGEYAFWGCKSLANVTMSESVTSIGKAAFRGCENLANIIIPESVVSIGDETFYGCTSLIDITMPDSLTSIGANMFACCESLTIINIPKSVTSIGKYAFAGCKNLTNITIPDNVISIDDGAFDECKNLLSISMPASLVHIGDIFSINMRLENIIVNKYNQNYTSKDGVLFDKNMSTLIVYPEGRKDVLYTIPDGITRIDPGAFVNCRHTKSVVIPKSVNVIGNANFNTITNIYYKGNKSKWNKVKDENGSQFICAEHITIHFNSNGNSLLGDINGDNTVDIQDAIVLLNHSMLPEIYQIKYIGSVDFNKDGSVDIRDAVLLLNYSMLPDIYPIN